MHYRDLVSASALAAHCDDPDWVILDCRFDLTNPDAGRASWREAHIPGALYADLEHDLSAAASATGGRHPLPDPADLADLFSRWGIGMQTQVVAYDDSSSAFAARVWWLLRWLGHPHVAVLDGGMQAWRRSGLPVVDAPASATPAHFEIRLQPGMTANADDVATLLERGGVVLDARAAARFLGDEEPLDARAGHIPGAHNFPYTANLDRHDRFLPPAELRFCYDAALQGTPPEMVVCMCGSGVTACHNLLAMELAGLYGARLYPGSWSEWCSDEKRAMTTGPDCSV